MQAAATKQGGTMGYHTSFRPSVPADGSKSVFAVGHRAYVECAKGRSAGVALTDDAGAVGNKRLVDGTEVEILAWLPRGNGTRYRVRSTRVGLEGWLPGTNLRRAKSITLPAKAATLVPAKAVTPVAAPVASVVSTPRVRSRTVVAVARRGTAVASPKAVGKRGARSAG